MTLEKMRAAAQGPTRKPTAVHLFCTRCERPVVANRITRECHDCQLAGVKAFGSVIPAGEMSGF